MHRNIVLAGTLLIFASGVCGVHRGGHPLQKSNALLGTTHDELVSSEQTFERGFFRTDCRDVHGKKGESAYDQCVRCVATKTGLVFGGALCTYCEPTSAFESQIVKKGTSKVRGGKASEFCFASSNYECEDKVFSAVRTQSSHSGTRSKAAADACKNLPIELSAVLGLYNFEFLGLAEHTKYVKGVFEDKTKLKRISDSARLIVPANFMADPDQKERVKNHLQYRHPIHIFGPEYRSIYIDENKMESALRYTKKEAYKVDKNEEEKKDSALLRYGIVAESFVDDAAQFPRDSVYIIHTWGVNMESENTADAKYCGFEGEPLSKYQEKLRKYQKKQDAKIAETDSEEESDAETEKIREEDLEDLKNKIPDVEDFKKKYKKLLYQVFDIIEAGIKYVHKQHEGKPIVYRTSKIGMGAWVGLLKKYDEIIKSDLAEHMVKEYVNFKAALTTKLDPENKWLQIRTNCFIPNNPNPKTFMRGHKAEGEGLEVFKDSVDYKIAKENENQQFFDKEKHYEKWYIAESNCNPFGKPKNVDDKKYVQLPEDSVLVIQNAWDDRSFIGNGGSDDNSLDGWITANSENFKKSDFFEEDELTKIKLGAVMPNTAYLHNAFFIPTLFEEENWVEAEEANLVEAEN